MTTVALARCGSYEAQHVEHALDELLAHLGGMAAFVKPGMTVLLKPNVLFGGKPERHVTTNPAVVRAVALLVQKAGGVVWIGDSPSIGTFKNAAISSGLAGIADEVGARLVEFDEWVTCKSRSGYRLKIARAVVDANAVINLPKVKSHGQMHLTMGVKNCFGCIPGGEKARWHFRAGVSEDSFARVLVNTYCAVHPVLTIADAVVAMEGNGPASGMPRHLGWLAASRDAVALDCVMLSLLGHERLNLKTIEQARAAGAGETDMAKITVAGVPVARLRVTDFKLPPRQVSLHFARLPKFMRKYFREFLTSRPVLRHNACTHCKRCFEVCPAKAIEWNEKNMPSFKYEKCIRCFCCQEMCPSGALYPHDGCALKVLRPFRNLMLKRWGI